MKTSDEMPFTLYVSEDECTMVEIWADGVVRVVTRPEPDLIPDVPVVVTRERGNRVGRREE